MDVREEYSGMFDLEGKGEVSKDFIMLQLWSTLQVKMSVRN